LTTVKQLVRAESTRSAIQFFVGQQVDHAHSSFRLFPEPAASSICNSSLGNADAASLFFGSVSKAPSSASHGSLSAAAAVRRLSGLHKSRPLRTRNPWSYRFATGMSWRSTLGCSRLSSSIQFPVYSDRREQEPRPRRARGGPPGRPPRPAGDRERRTAISRYAGVPAGSYGGRSDVDVAIPKSRSLTSRRPSTTRMFSDLM
jgi:hypothetical protein